MLILASVIGTCGTVLLAAATYREGAVLLGRSPLPRERLFLRLAGFLAYGVSLLLLAQGSPNAAFSIIVWIGLLTPEILIAACLCSAISARRSAGRRM